MAPFSARPRSKSIRGSIEFNPVSNENKSMRFAFLFLIFLTVEAVVAPDKAFAVAEAPTCAVEKLATPLTPEKLKHFLKNSKIKKVEDLICCLPPEFQKNYVVIHSSFAFQAGVPDHPRVILYQPQAGNRKNLDMAITFTGDDKSLNGFNNVEVMYNNPTKSEAELYDIDFNQKHLLSEANPKECLGCHSPNSKELKTAGVKPIFTDSPWPYAVGVIGSSVFEDKGRKYFAKIEDHAKKAIQTQPRYACLQPTDHFASNVVELNDLTTELNRQRVAKLILATPDYTRFRPLIVGASLGCLDGTFNTPEDLKRFENNFSKWVSPEAARSIFNNDSSISAKYKNAQNLQKETENFEQEAIDQELAARFQRSKQTDTDIGSKPAVFYPTSTTSIYASPLSKEIFYNQQSVKSLNGFSEPTKLFARYTLDTQNQHQVGFGASALMRFLFEGRGISTLTWSRSMAGGYNTNLRLSIDDLKAQSADDPYWKELGNFPTSIDPNSADRSAYEAKKKVCATLSQQSLRNLSQAAANSGTSSTGRH
jgi:hypothetical protein